jgi:hypothetical protein
MASNITSKPPQQPQRHTLEPTNLPELAKIEKKVAAHQSLTRNEQVVLHTHLYGYFSAAGVKQQGTLQALGQHEITLHQAASTPPEPAATVPAPTLPQLPAPLPPPQIDNSGMAAPVDSSTGVLMDSRIVAPNAATGGAGFTDQQILDMVVNGLASRAAIASFDPNAPAARIGDPSKAAQWDLAKAHQLNLGIQTAAQFFPGVAPVDLAHLIIAEGLHESTGDTQKNIGGKPGDGMGFMQATPQSVVKDFMQFGTVVKAADGSVVLDPTVSPNLADPAVNVALFAWYSANSLAAGTSLDAKLTWGNPANVDPANKDYGNAMLTWFGGPNNDRHAAGSTFNDSQYIKQTQDYFTQSGFGDAAKFQALLSTPLDSTLRNVRGQ